MSLMAEIKAAALSITGPHIDISNEEKFFAQALPLINYADAPEENFPIVLALVEKETASLVANNRFEISSTIDISVIYKINPDKETIENGVQRGRNCVMQVANELMARQTSGAALLPMYLDGDIDIDATADYGIDHSETDTVNGAASAKFTVKQIQQPMAAEPIEPPPPEPPEPPTPPEQPEPKSYHLLGQNNEKLLGQNNEQLLRQIA